MIMKHATQRRHLAGNGFFSIFMWMILVNIQLQITLVLNDILSRDLFQDRKIEVLYRQILAGRVIVLHERKKRQQIITI